MDSFVSNLWGLSERGGRCRGGEFCEEESFFNQKGRGFTLDFEGGGWRFGRGGCLRVKDFRLISTTSPYSLKYIGKLVYRVRSLYKPLPPPREHLRVHFSEIFLLLRYLFDDVDF